MHHPNEEPIILDHVIVLRTTGFRPFELSGLSYKCSTSELQQVDNHHPHNPLYMSCIGGTECPSHMPSSHSACVIRTWLGSPPEFLLIMRESSLVSQPYFSLRKMQLACETRKYLASPEFRGSTSVESSLLCMQLYCVSFQNNSFYFLALEHCI